MSGSFVLGVDGCPKGWIAVRLFPHKGYPTAPDMRLFETFHSLMRSEWGQAELIMVDIPIGLADSGRRGCDALARKLLGPKRGTSVFPAPRRPMLAMPSYEKANAWGKKQGREAGGGLSKQAWNILPKIREVDDELSPELQSKIREAHPEVAFHRLNGGAPVLAPKKSKSGSELRKTLLYQYGLIEIDRIWHKFADGYSRQAVREDDFIDACVLALTGRDIVLDKPVHHLTLGNRDRHRLIMEIWG